VRPLQIRASVAVAAILASEVDVVDSMMGQFISQNKRMFTIRLYTAVELTVKQNSDFHYPQIRT
jgi:hypothetical protein